MGTGLKIEVPHLQNSCCFCQWTQVAPEYSPLLHRWKSHTPGQEQWSSRTAGSVWIVSGSDDITDLCLQKDWRRSFLSHARGGM